MVHFIVKWLFSYKSSNHRERETKTDACLDYHCFDKHVSRELDKPVIGKYKHFFFSSLQIVSVLIASKKLAGK